MTMADDAPLAPEEHLSKAIENIKAAQRKAPDAIRDDEFLIRAAVETGAARAYITAARNATGDDDE